MISPLLRDLVRALEQNAISYCHWKGNYRLATGISDRAEFDILIDRQSLLPAMSLFNGLNFKLALPRWSHNTPAMLHYFGFDSAQEKPIHLHLHCAIFSGENFIDSHCYPFTRMLLEHTEICNGIRIPSRGAELLVYVLKLFIRFGSMPDLLFQRLKPNDVQNELQWLQQGNAKSEAIALLNEHYPAIGEKLFMQCLQLLNENRGSLARKTWLAMQIRQRLRMWSRYTAWSRLLAYRHFLWVRVVRMLNATRSSKMLGSGGAVIAMVGPEASGKSTLLANWLSGSLIARSVNAGGPPATLLTFPVNLLLAIARKFIPGLRANCSAGYVSDSSGKTRADSLSALLCTVRAVSLAWETQRHLLAMRRAAANGWIVFCDHYPAQESNAIDGSNVRLAAASGGLIARLCSRLQYYEERLYRQIPPPDIVIRLRVSLAVAKQHGGNQCKACEQGVDYMEASRRQMGEWRHSGVDCIYDIDSSGSPEKILQSVKNTVWNAL